MAGPIHIYDAVVEIAGVDLSDHVEAVTLDESYDALETTAMGDTHRTRQKGLGDFSLAITWQQDYDAAEVHVTIQPINGDVATFAVKHSSAATSTTNEQWSGSVFISEYTYLPAQIGNLATFQTTWAGSGALAVATS